MIDFSNKISLLKEKSDSSPEYGDIIDYTVGLYTFLSGHAAETGITVPVPTDDTATRNGFPLLSPDSLIVDEGVTTRFITLLVDHLISLGREGGEFLERLSTSLSSTPPHWIPLFTAILTRDRRPIDTAAGCLGIPSPLFEYILEIPLKTALELAASNIDPARFCGWKEAICPLCGSRPGIASFEGEEGKRHLYCSTCSTRWEFSRLRCPYCGCEDREKLSYFLVDTDRVRVDTCKGCSRAIKTVDRRKGGVESRMPPDILDVVTMHLDLLASREGFERGR